MKSRVERVLLTEPIVFNGDIFFRLKIELDHINFGLDQNGELKPKRRSNFTVKDIVRFLRLLDGEYILPRKRRKNSAQFEIRIDCPVPGRFYKREFIMVFDTNVEGEASIHTITLFPGR